MIRGSLLYLIKEQKQQSSVKPPALVHSNAQDNNAVLDR
ncbi:hypothetical protein SynA1825c_01019 [Synechococcus sp. A18-25c]|nr:hypothetical protein SynA1825c_01019 [Synechococcus sp. A18-25c]